jgi:prefoldin subunit 5
MNQAAQPSAETLSAAVRALEEAINGLRHSQNILVAAMGIIAALFLGALVWLASDVGGLRQEIASDISTVRQQVSSDISTLRQEVSSDISALRQQIAAVETRIETSSATINARIDALNARVDNLVVAVGELRAAIGAIGTRIDEMTRSQQNRAELDLERSRSAGDSDARAPESPGTGAGR